MLGSAPIGAALGVTAAMPEAVKQALTCLRKSGSLFLEVLVISKTEVSLFAVGCHSPYDF